MIKFTEYIPEKHIEETILEGNLVPQNIKQPKKLDDLLKQLVNTNNTLLVSIHGTILLFCMSLYKEMLP